MEDSIVLKEHKCIHCGEITYGDKPAFCFFCGYAFFEASIGDYYTPEGKKLSDCTKEEQQKVLDQMKQFRQI